jgi:glycosidase
MSLLAVMKSRKMHGMADLVINHRVGTDTWNDFTEPAWSCDAICMDDEGYTNPDAFGTTPCGDLDEGEGWGGARDLNHKSEEVQLGIKAYLGQLKALGFDSWRYDFVKGFPAKYVGEYNAATPYYLSVGEYWDGNPNALRSWIDKTSETLSGSPTPKAAAFDFAIKYRLAEAVVQKKYTVLQANPSLASIEGYGEKAITFLDNHDTGCINRNDCDNVFSKNTSELIQGYAYLLTHPGIPMVWGYHYFFSDAFGSLQKEINALIALRKAFGINANSKVVVVEAKDGASGYYVAQIDQNLLVKIGGGTYAPDAQWKEERKNLAYTVWTR